MRDFFSADQFHKIISFFRKYGIFIAPAFLFLFFMSILVFSYTQSRVLNKPKIAVSSPAPTEYPFPSSQQGSPSGSPIPSNKPLNSGIGLSEKSELGWSPVPFSENDISGLNATQTTLSDGTTQYSYSSDSSNREDMLIVKNGTIIFQRMQFSNTPLTADTNFYGKPEYVANGSRVYGQNIMTYIYLSQGIALVGDPKSNQLFEQLYFEPGNMDELKLYDIDMIGSPQKT